MVALIASRHVQWNQTFRPGSHRVKGHADVFTRLLSGWGRWLQVQQRGASGAECFSTLVDEGVARRINHCGFPWRAEGHCIVGTLKCGCWDAVAATGMCVVNGCFLVSNGICWQRRLCSLVDISLAPGCPVASASRTDQLVLELKC